MNEKEAESLSLIDRLIDKIDQTNICIIDSLKQEELELMSDHYDDRLKLFNILNQLITSLERSSSPMVQEQVKKLKLILASELKKTKKHDDYVINSLSELKDQVSIDIKNVSLNKNKFKGYNLNSVK
jgi:hypothetical protein